MQLLSACSKNGDWTTLPLTGCSDNAGNGKHALPGIRHSFLVPQQLLLQVFGWAPTDTASQNIYKQPLPQYLRRYALHAWALRVGTDRHANRHGTQAWSLRRRTACCGATASRTTRTCRSSGPCTAWASSRTGPPAVGPWTTAPGTGWHASCCSPAMHLGPAVPLLCGGAEVHNCVALIILAVAGPHAA